MSKSKLLTTVTSSLSKASFQIKKHSPEILVVSGIVGTVASAVLACRATTKASAVLNNAKVEIDTIHACMNDPETADRYKETTGEEYTPEVYKKDLTIAYSKTGAQLVKLYAPSVILGALSITSILASNNILRKRNVALAAAYAAIDTSFKEYRGRVIDRFGEAVDRELKYNIKAKEIEVIETDEKTGKEKKVKKTVEVVGPNFGSPYAKFFDESCRPWEKDPELNLLFLRAEQNWANDRLKSRKYLFLNEVYERLDIDPTPAGQHVGWIYDPDNPDHNGDNFVDFGIYDTHRETSRNFVNGLEPVILLDFNVDGDIYKLMETDRYANKFVNR